MPHASRMTLAAVLTALLAFAAPAYGADGDLDPTFGGDGITELDRPAEGIQIARQSDGKVLVLGRYGGRYLARLTPTGAVDTAFGQGGYVALGFAGTAIEVQPDDKIVVAGSRGSGSATDAAVARFNPDGTPDAAFGGDGQVQFDLAAAGTGFVADVAVQPNRRILVTGGSSESYGFVAARLKIDGTLDTSFSGDGRVAEDLGYYTRAHSMVLQGSRIVLVGSTFTDSDPFIGGPHVAALALTSSGARDTSFGPDGNGAFVDQGTATPTDATRAQDGGILVAASGDADIGFGTFTILKLGISGRPDPAFSGDGVARVVLVPEGVAHAASVTTTADGNYAVGGEVALGVDGAVVDHFAIAKVSPQGELVPSFGDGGKRFYSPETASDLALQPNGKLLVGVVNRRADDPRISVARIQDAGSTPGQPQPPLLTLTAGSAVEGQLLPFTATLSRASDQPVTFSYFTGEGTAANDRDFGTRSGTVTIPPGQTSATIAVPTNADRLFETDESFRVELHGATNARFGEYVAFGTIVNDLRPGRCQNVVQGRRGTDILTGSPGGDLIVGRQDVDFLFGLAGADCIRGERGGDIIDGGDGDDLVDGGSGDDRIKGGDGDDRLLGRRGRNRYNGGGGNDTIYARNGIAEIVECGPGRDRVKADSRDRLRRCEIVTR